MSHSDSFRYNSKLPSNERYELGAFPFLNCTLVYSRPNQAGYRNYLRVEQPLPSLSKVEDRGQEVAGCGGEGAGVFMT